VLQQQPTIAVAELSATLLSVLHQGLFHIPSDPAEMYELALDRASIPLCFLNLSYLIILKYVQYG
jgi:hypothetical protein